LRLLRRLPPVNAKAKANNNDLDVGGSYQVDKAVSEASAEEFDGLIIPGGCVGADKLRADKDVVALAHPFFELGKPVGVICHGPWLLVEADVLGTDSDLVSDCSERHRQRRRHMG
jgi:protease I